MTLKKGLSVSHPLSPSDTATRSVPVGAPLLHPAVPFTQLLTLPGLCGSHPDKSGLSNHSTCALGENTVGQLMCLRPRSSSARKTKTAELFSHENPKLQAT